MTSPPPDPPTTDLAPYATEQQARDAGASGTPTEIEAALVWSRATIDIYCRALFAPTDLTVEVMVGDGEGRLPYWAATVTTGTLEVDGRTWHPDDWGSGVYHVEGDFGYRDTPAPVQMASARLAAVYSPAEFTAQADAEGNPIGRPPAPTQQDESDPSPPQQRAGASGERTTGDPVADAWLEPYKTRRVMVG